MSLQDNIVHRIVADIMDTGKLGQAWNEIDINSRYVIMEGWRQIIKNLIESKLEEITDESL